MKKDMLKKIYYENHFHKSRIRIYSDRLGTIGEMADLFTSIEKNYINLLAYQKIMYELTFFNFEQYSFEHPLHILDKYLHYDAHIRFLTYQRFYNIDDFVFQEEYPIITKINYNSPGFFEIIASWSPFEQIRMYIKDRHDRIKDKNYVWDMDKKMKETEIETKRLNNDLLRLKIMDKVITQLKDIGLSEFEIRHTIQKYYGDLELLNSHINDERIVNIENIDDEVN